MSKVKIGNHNALGYKHTKEAKQKLREAHIGTHLSEETKKKIGAAMKGRQFSEETRRKMSEAAIVRYAKIKAVIKTTE